MAFWDEGVNLAICYTANHDQIKRDWPVMLTRMHKPEKYILSCKGAHIKSTSLNEHLAEAANHNCTHVLFMDVDMQFPEFTIPKLFMDFKDCPDNTAIISGMYHLKSTPFSPIAGWVDKEGTCVNGNGISWKTDYCPLPDNKLVEVHWTGIGCMLVDMKVFDKIWFPPFWDTWNKELGNRQKGHDVILCQEVRKAGYRVFVDTRIDCMHIGDMFVNKAWVQGYHKANMDQVLLETVKDIASENPWWDEIWMDAYMRNMARPQDPIMEAIKEYIPDGSRVADFGCGDGTLLSMLKTEKNCNVYGYDFSPESIRYINARDIEGKVADIRTYNSNGDSYHTVVMSHMLEHLKDVDIPRAIQTISNMAEEQAFIIVPKEPYLHIEHRKIYDEDMLKNELSPYFENVEVMRVMGSERLNPELRKTYRHLIAHCKGPIREAREAGDSVEMFKSG